MTEPQQQPAANGNGAKKKTTIIILVIATIACALYGAKWLAHRMAFTTTEDAQIDADLLPVSSKASGRIIRFYVSEGDTVKAGQLLAEIDPTDYKLAAERAEAALEIARRELEKAQSGLALTDASTESSVLQSEASLEQVTGSVTISTTQRDVNLSKLRKDAERAELNLKRAGGRADEVRTLADQTLKDLDRAETLYKSGVISKAQLDLARTNAEAAADRLAQSSRDREDAEKQLEIARSNLRSALVDSQRVSMAGMDRRKAGLALGLSRKQRDENMRSARVGIEALRAKVRDAAAALKQAHIALAETTIKSPVAGMVAKKTAARTEFVPAGRAICFILDTSKAWVTANIEETNLKNITLGAETSVTVDAVPGKTFHGKVGMIGAAANSKFALIPQSNPSGQFIKVTQRIPVKIYLDGDTSALRPGMNVEVEIKNR